MYRAWCRKCKTALFDVPSIEAMFGNQDEVEIICRGCGWHYTLTHGVKEVLYQHGKAKSSKAQYYH